MLRGVTVVQREVARWQSQAEAAAEAVREVELRMQAASTSSAAAAKNALEDARAARSQVWRGHTSSVSSCALLLTGTPTAFLHGVIHLHASLLSTA
jgi:hypothetical protein